MTTAAPAPTVPPPVPQTPGSKTPGSRTPGNKTLGNNTSGKRSLAADLAGRRREVMTPEGVALSFTIASRGARAGALILDLAIISFALIALVIAVVALGLGFLDLDAQIGEASPALELLAILAIAGLFLARYSYFLLFELGPRGATPGKRLVGIRVAARPGSTGAAGRLTAEAVLARNLTRDIEVFMPVAFLLSGGYAQGALGLAATVWLGIFLLFPFFNRDSLARRRPYRRHIRGRGRARQACPSLVARCRATGRIPLRTGRAFGLWRTRIAGARGVVADRR